jgi:hypothetical protein
MNRMIKAALVSVASLSSIVSTVALAKHHENCEVEGKKIHVKNKAECEQKKGKPIEMKKEEGKKEEGKKEEVKKDAAVAPAVTPTVDSTTQDSSKK